MKASSVGAKKVKGPGPESVSEKSTASSADESVLKRSFFLTIWIISLIGILSLRSQARLSKMIEPLLPLFGKNDRIDYMDNTIGTDDICLDDHGIVHHDFSVFDGDGQALTVCSLS